MRSRAPKNTMTLHLTHPPIGQPGALRPRRLPRAQRGHGGLRAVAVSLCMAMATAAAAAADTTPARLLERFAAEAGRPGQPEAGQTFFTRTHGGTWSCASCHGEQPTLRGRHASTGKAIAALAPAANRSAFTDTAQVDKWFRRNCRDVLRRECSAGEKADVLAWLGSLR
jgi:hypothetical protein